MRPDALLTNHSQTSVVWSKCLRGRTNGALSHEGILALQGGEDVNTRAYHQESLTLRDTDYEGDPLGKRSHVLPWSLATLNSPAEAEFHLTSLVDERVADVAAKSIGYISS